MSSFIFFIEKLSSFIFFIGKLSSFIVVVIQNSVSRYALIVKHQSASRILVSRLPVAFLPDPTD